MTSLTRHLIGTLLLSFLLGSCCEAAAVGNAEALTSIGRALQFLQKEAFAWKETRRCAACHHASLVMWTFNEAKAAGYPADERALKEITDWTFGDMKTNSLTAQPPPRDVVNLGWVYVLLSMETASNSVFNASTGDTNLLASKSVADTNEDIVSSARKILVEQIIAKQTADGSWGRPLDERVPLGGPMEDIALLCRLALLQNGEGSVPAIISIEKAGNWLAANEDKTSRQARNFRLLIRQRESKSLQELRPAIESIISEQNPDGGWSQTPELGSDAYATGQALYVLTRAGIKPGTTVLKRGVEFLKLTQREDGSWPMRSRVNAKNLKPITAAGTAWALLGLVRASS